MSAEYSVDAKEYLDNCVNALDHIARTARNCRVTSKRLTWIASRAESAINSNDAWRDAPVPVNGTSALLRAQARIKELEAALATQGQGEAVYQRQTGTSCCWEDIGRERYEKAQRGEIDDSYTLACETRVLFTATPSAHGQNSAVAYRYRFHDGAGGWLGWHYSDTPTRNFVEGDRVQHEILYTAPPASPAGVPDVQEKYDELILAVGNKYRDETRHETALRYIKQAEQQSSIPCAAPSAPSATPEGGEVGL